MKRLKAVPRRNLGNFLLLSGQAADCFKIATEAVSREKSW
jgi:hypothetical protein